MTPGCGADRDAIARQNALANLDRDWKHEREGLLVRGRFGRTHVPTAAASLVTMALGLAIGVTWTVAAFSLLLPGPTSFMAVSFGMLFLLVVLIGSSANYNKAVNYRQREAEYIRRRQELERQ